MEDNAAEQLLQLLVTRIKEAGTTPSGVRSHGATGTFSNYGVNPDIINATPQIVTGLAAVLRRRLSVLTNEVFEILTGVTASTGNEPTTACADATQPGNLKVCNQTWPFGRLVKDSQVIQADRAGELLNRSEFIDYRVIGDPLGDANGVPALASIQDALRSETKRKLYELVFSLHRDYGKLLYVGNPGNTSSSTGYIEYNGLDRIINTGYRDAFSGVACPAADSIVRSFSSAIVQSNGATAVAEITETIRALRYLAERTGLSPVEHVLTMRYSLFMALTEVWPCAYLTYRCTTAAPNSDATVHVDAQEQNAMRKAMRDGMYLLVDDREIPVVIDDFITEDNPVAGQFESDIYVVPLRAAGADITFFEDFNLAGPYGMVDAVRDMAPQGMFEVLGGGRYWLHRKPPSNECIQIRMGTKPRVICRAPFLAARLTDYRYTTRIHERSPFPGYPYHYDGGQYVFGSPYFYPPFSS